jgi:hypothetical protein
MEKAQPGPQFPMVPFFGFFQAQQIGGQFVRVGQTVP